MPKYVCIRTCYQGAQHWVKGDVMDSPATECPPHFAPVGTPVPKDPPQFTGDMEIANPVGKAQSGEKVALSELAGLPKGKPLVEKRVSQSEVEDALG